MSELLSAEERELRTAIAMFLAGHHAAHENRCFKEVCDYDELDTHCRLCRAWASYRDLTAASTPASENTQTEEGDALDALTSHYDEDANTVTFWRERHALMEEENAILLTTVARLEAAVRKLAVPNYGNCYWCLPLGNSHPTDCTARPCNGTACINKHLVWAGAASLSTDTPREREALLEELERERKWRLTAEQKAGHLYAQNRKLRFDLYNALGLVKAKLDWWPLASLTDTPEVCPTCGSDDPKVRGWRPTLTNGHWNLTPRPPTRDNTGCPDPFHDGGSR